MPPLMVFPLVRRNNDYLKGALAGGWAEFTSSGWMQSDIFYKWMQKFIEFSRATKEKPVLLILDGHSTHAKNPDLIDLAVENGVTMISFPPHTTHKLQPLDLGLMKPLSTFMTGELRKTIRKQEGKPVSMKQLFELFSKAFLKAATLETAVNSFKKPGIYPLDRNVFTDNDFLPNNNNLEDFETDESGDMLDLSQNKKINNTPLPSSSNSSASLENSSSINLEKCKIFYC